MIFPACKVSKTYFLYVLPQEATEGSKREERHERDRKKKRHEAQENDITLERDKGNSQDDDKREVQDDSANRLRADQYRLEQEKVKSKEEVSMKQIKCIQDVFGHSERVSQFLQRLGNKQFPT